MYTNLNFYISTNKHICVICEPNNLQTCLTHRKFTTSIPLKDASHIHLNGATTTFPELKSVVSPNNDILDSLPPLNTVFKESNKSSVLDSLPPLNTVFKDDKIKTSNFNFDNYKTWDIQEYIERFNTFKTSSICNNNINENKSEKISVLQGSVKDDSLNIWEQLFNKINNLINIISNYCEHFLSDSDNLYIIALLLFYLLSLIIHKLGLSKYITELYIKSYLKSIDLARNAILAKLIKKHLNVLNFTFKREKIQLSTIKFFLKLIDLAIDDIRDKIIKKLLKDLNFTFKREEIKVSTSTSSSKTKFIGGQTLKKLSKDLNFCSLHEVEQQSLFASRGEKFIVPPVTVSKMNAHAAGLEQNMLQVPYGVRINELLSKRDNTYYSPNNILPFKTPIEILLGVRGVIHYQALVNPNQSASITKGPIFLCGNTTIPDFYLPYPNVRFQVRWPMRLPAFGIPRRHFPQVADWADSRTYIFYFIMWLWHSFWTHEIDLRVRRINIADNLGNLKKYFAIYDENDYYCIFLWIVYYRNTNIFAYRLPNDNSYINVIVFRNSEDIMYNVPNTRWEYIYDYPDFSVFHDYIDLAGGLIDQLQAPALLRAFYADWHVADPDKRMIIIPAPNYSWYEAIRNMCPGLGSPSCLIILNYGTPPRQVHNTVYRSMAVKTSIWEITC